MSIRNLQRFLVLASLLLPVSALRAQIVGATITGTVRDSTGAVIAGATVSVRNTQTGASRVVTTPGPRVFWLADGPPAAS